MIKHRDEGDLEKKVFSLGLMVPEGESPLLSWWEAWQQAAGRQALQQAGMAWHCSSSGEITF